MDTPLFKLVHPVELVFIDDEGYHNTRVELSPFTEKLEIYGHCEINDLLNVKYLRIELKSDVTINQEHHSKLISVNAEADVIRRLIPICPCVRKITCRDKMGENYDDTEFSLKMNDLYQDLERNTSLTRLSIHDTTHIPPSSLLKNLRVYKGPASREFIQEAEKIGKLKVLEITSWSDVYYLALGYVVIRGLPLISLSSRKKINGLSFVVDHPMKSVSNVCVQFEHVPTYNEDDDLF